MKQVKLILLALSGLVALAQDPENWKRPIVPFQISGNVYYVGTEDLGCYLVTTKQGHILVNTGLAESLPLINASK